MRAALLPLLPLLLLAVSPSSTLAAKRGLFTSDKVRKANDSTLPSKAQVRAAKGGCILKFYPLNPKEPWPTTASPNHIYRLAFEVINRNKTGPVYKDVYLGIQKPPSASKPTSFRARPALPNATLVPNFPLFIPSPPLPKPVNVPWFLYGPFDVLPGTKQYIEFAYNLTVCSPGIAWNVTMNVNPFPRPPPLAQFSFTRLPPFTGPCFAYDYRRKYNSKAKVPCT